MALTASSQDTEAALGQRRSEMDQAWRRIDEGWKDLQQRMAEIGITKASDANEGMVQLNVGGSCVNVRRSVLDGKQGSSSSGWTLANLFEARWDKRVPVDKEGRYVLDESPIAVKHLIHALLTGPQAGEKRSQESGAPLIAVDEEPFLPFVSHALGLSDSTVMAAVTGGSTVLGPTVSDTIEAALQAWFPGETTELEYRATRDGWAAAAFHASVMIVKGH